jgi:hypothetical protein
MEKRSRSKPLAASLPGRAGKEPGPELQQLLDAISSGAIVDVDELEDHELELLRAYAHDDESVQALLDRLRAADPGET